MASINCENESELAVRIGTSGWHYKHWLGAFYPEGTPASRMLEFYCQQFDTVELNNDQEGYAAQNALRLKKLVGPARAEV